MKLKLFTFNAYQISVCVKLINAPDDLAAQCLKTGYKQACWNETSLLRLFLLVYFKTHWTESSIYNYLNSLIHSELD